MYKNLMTSEIKSGDLNIILFSLCLMSFISTIGFGIVVPIIPFLAVEHGSNDFVYGLLMAIFPLFQFLFSPLWGRWSDQVGRVPVLVIGLIGSAVSFALFGLANSLLLLFVSRILSGVFTAATLPTSHAYIADYFPSEKRGVAFGYLGASQAMGFAIGPAIGGVLVNIPFLTFSYHFLPSMFASLLAVFAFILTILFIRESLSPEKRLKMKMEKLTDSSQISAYKTIQNDYHLLVLILIFGVIGFGMASFITAFGQFGPRVYGIGPREIGIIFSYAGFLIAFTQGILIKPLMKFFGETFLIKVGLFSIFIGFIVILLVDTFLLSFLATTPLFFGVALINPPISSMISSIVPTNIQGEIMGIKQGFSAFMRVVGPVCAGTFLMINLYLLFIVNVGVFLVFIIATFNFKKPQKKIISPNKSI
jgi:MFS transporter, DHA1 family, multidrug resistance protein